MAVSTQTNRINISNGNGGGTGTGTVTTTNINKNITITTNLTNVGNFLTNLFNNTNITIGGGLGNGSVSISNISNVGNNGGVAVIAGGNVDIEGGVVANGGGGTAPFAKVDNVTATGGGVLISDQSVRLVDKMSTASSDGSEVVRNEINSTLIRPTDNESGESTEGESSQNSIKRFSLKNFLLSTRKYFKSFSFFRSKSPDPPTR